MFGNKRTVKFIHCRLPEDIQGDQDEIRHICSVLSKFFAQHRTKDVEFIPFFTSLDVECLDDNTLIAVVEDLLTKAYSVEGLEQRVDEIVEKIKFGM